MADWTLFLRIIFPFVPSEAEQLIILSAFGLCWSVYESEVHLAEF